MFRISCARVGVLLSLLMLLSACASTSWWNAGSSSVSVPESPASSSSAQMAAVSTPAAASSAEPPQAPEDEPVQEVFQPVYDFSQPVPENTPVDNAYFEDAAFVGDSRTDGFLIYSGIGCGENLTSNGLSIFQLGEKKAIKRDGVSYTLLEALALKEYSKVYLSLGVNELGIYNDEGFYQAYCDAIDAIRAAQPNAVIYIQGLIPLNEDVIKTSGGKDYLRNDHLLVYNDLMKKAAQEKQVAFLDLNPQFADENGQLPADASRDGVHLKSGYCKQWLEYLKTHTVDYETMYPNAEVTNDETIYYSAPGEPDGPVPDSLQPGKE